MTARYPECPGTTRLRFTGMLIPVVITAQCLLVPLANATSICRWINEKGQTEMSDVVPDRYRSIVNCTHTEPAGADELSSKQRAAPERDKRRSSALTPREKPASGSTAAPSQTAASRPVLKRPAEIVTDKTDCTTWQRIYDESGACFAPFRTAKGGIKAEAFAQCNEVPNPEQKCGPQRN